MSELRSGSSSAGISSIVCREPPDVVSLDLSKVTSHPLMRLSQAQRKKVESLCLEYSVVDSPEQAVRHALHAIVVGDAAPAAWEFTEAAEVIWVTPMVWAREEVHMTVETAREILKEALSSGTWETPAPEDDDQAIKDAEGLVKMAEDAWEQNIRGPEVEAILRIAAADPEAEAEPAKPAAKKAPTKPAVKKPGPPKKAAPEPEAEAAPDAPEEPWDGYDGNKVVEIVEGVEVWGEDLDENLAYLLNLYAYEQANKNRKNIVAACESVIPADEIPAAAEPEPDPEPEPEAEVPEEWAAEPFETYDKLKVSDIKESLDDYWADEDISMEDKQNVLGHVSYYEGSNKARSGLVDYLEAVQQMMEEAAGVDTASAEEEAGEAEGAATPEADAPAASRPARSTGGGKKAAVAAGEGDPGNATTYTVTAEVGDSTIEYTLGGKHAVAGTILDLIDLGSTSISISG